MSDKMFSVFCVACVCFMVMVALVVVAILRYQIDAVCYRVDCLESTVYTADKVKESITRMRERNKPMTVCPKCGKNSWSICETILWTGCLSESGEMQIDNIKTSSIATVECNECGYELNEDELNALDFNWADNPEENPEYTD